MVYSSPQEILCTAVLHKQKYDFAFYKNGEEEGRAGYACGVGTSGSGGEYGQRV
jgi:hypothetical protein